MATIPEIREELHRQVALLRLEAAAVSRHGLVSLARSLRNIATNVDKLAEDTKRKVGPRGPVRAEPITRAIWDGVRKLKKAHPRMLNRTIAARFNIDGGRVSEIITGKRKRPPQ